MQLSKDISTGLTTSQQLIVLLLLAFGLNFNTLFHEYALDDAVVLTGNTLVQKGVAGIPEILSHELFYGLEKQESDLSGGRYRPFALIVFALEVQFFGINPFVSHLINVLLFVFLIALLFRLLQKYIFRELNPNLAFLTCLLFVVHPIHTEVIANVKSRDELIAFILLLLSAFSILRYLKNRKLLSLLPAAFCFFISLLTRESAIPFIGIVPLTAYFFYNQSIKKSSPPFHSAVFHFHSIHDYPDFSCRTQSFYRQGCIEQSIHSGYCIRGICYKNIFICKIYWFAFPFPIP
ncbi:MAG: hypothetical protein IPO39_13735 [Bacteroidetes bacterium]|nr:hypothetical protein [Bacteroidota bacterium]